MRGADLIGMPVVDASTGDDIAEVRDVVFDPARGSITGMTLRKRGFLGRRMRQVLPIESVLAVGTHAVMVAGTTALTDLDDAPDEVVPDQRTEVVRDEVITESGKVLGRVGDVVLVGGNEPHVVGFEVSDGPVGPGLVPLSAHTAVSGGAVIVPDDFESRIRTDLTGLAAELALMEGDRS
jgi:uncharacterized protein YrrD